MAENSHFGSFAPALRSDQKEARQTHLATVALESARSLIWVPNATRSRHFPQRVKRLSNRMRSVLASVAHKRAAESEEQKWLGENSDLLGSQLAGLQELRDGLTRTAHVRRTNGDVVPRPLVIAEDLLFSLDYRFEETGFVTFLHSFQTATVLRMEELWELIPAMQLVLLERVADIAELNAGKNSETVKELAACITSLREVEQTPWQETLEPLIVFDKVLRRDPAGAYERMDMETRELYRREVVYLAKKSECTEVEVAELAVSLARQSLDAYEPDSRVTLRRSHVGYYLIAEGRESLCRRADVRLSPRDRVQALLRRYPDEFYLSGIEILTLGMILTLLWWINFNSLWSALIAALALLIPCSQSAVEIMNHIATSILEPRPLPKLDFSDGIPEDCATIVVVPTLLLNEKQVRQTVHDLEVRYVANMSANLHFALLTDFPDSTEQPSEHSPLVDLCGELIDDLNRKYAASACGTFSMYHRHRVYNPREGVWMGWERKRGKLLDFNKLVLGEYDSFPFKAGDTAVLPGVRYVLTLDSDTELSRGTAQRLIGALAHPLGQAIVDRKRNVVVHGYGILQPRVGISIESATQSRLASIYSGRTGFDIYTHATSDVYQDLYGEGTFVGKGLYELRTVHRVLDQRFPRNAILSHDLIEGAYTRAALVNDVEVIDHYPSHYSAYVRRKHRWVRGDWQTIEWLFSKVRNEKGQRVSNPISLISRWKILDNLRRSIVEPATLALFLVAWAILPGKPLYWTLVPLGILFAPTAFQFLVKLLRVMLGGGLTMAKDALGSLVTGFAGVLLSIAFLLHDSLVSIDAIWRSLYRRSISRQKLLEWETAAQAEAGKKKRTHLDLYLLSTPVIALGIGAWLSLVRRGAIWTALPILILWASSKLISLWLDRPPRVRKHPASRKDELFVRATALRTWRYFAELSNEEHNWLIPDNLQTDPPQVAARVSPTNVGLLLNARQVAAQLGYLTVPEFVHLTRHTLDTMDRLESHRGHLLNWYDTRTLAPLEPQFISTVDSGNLAASLLSLKSGCLDMLEKPLLSKTLIDGYDDHLRALANIKVLSKRKVRRTCRTHSQLSLIESVFDLMSDPLASEESGRVSEEAPWFAAQLQARKVAVEEIVTEYMPWLLPELESLCGKAAKASSQIPLSQLPALTEKLQIELNEKRVGFSGQDRVTCERLLTLLRVAHARCVCLVQDLRSIADEADTWFKEMDFAFLLNRRRKLLSIGFDPRKNELNPACYDLLASEARIAAFIAIAKGDIPQEVWFRLGRAQVHSYNSSTLASWSGTMFEYLMPAIWMKSYPDTLLQRSMEGAVQIQRQHAARKHIVWGISESAYYEMDDAGAFQYRAFGVPAVALSNQEERLVTAPYAVAMALGVDPDAALDTLNRMFQSRWYGQYGFYEAVDYGRNGSRRRHPKIVTSWMAHHQGMILLSLVNFVCDDIIQKWFHADVRVQSTELLLHERAVTRRIRPLAHINIPKVSLRTLASPGKKLAFEN